MGPRLRFFTCCCLLVLLQAGPAFAMQVLVVRPPTDDTALFEAFGRLRAELALQGFDVVAIPASEALAHSDALELAASKRGAFAAIALRRDANGTTAVVHIVDRVTGKTVARKLEIAGAEDGPMLLAIRAADLLRTSLLELGPGERPPEDIVGVEEDPPSPEVLRFARQVPRFRIGAGVLSIWHPAIGASWGGQVELAFRPVARLGLEIALGGPAFGGEYRPENGTARIRQEFGLVRTWYNFGSAEPGPRWEWGPVLGLGLVHVHAAGDVQAPLASRTSDLWAFGVTAGGRLEIYMSETVSLRLDLAALSVVPQPVVAVAEQESEPLVVQGVASLGLGVSF